MKSEITKTNMTNLDLLKLESKMAQDKIDIIKKFLNEESKTVRIPVVEQVSE
jgi:hypothetical protein